MNEPLHIIQLLVAPVVMISAGGLICLALYNRLAMIVTRARAFHKERFDSITRLTCLPLDRQDTVEATQLRQRNDILDMQSRQILIRAKLIRNSLIGLIVMILCMLGCSLSLGATLVWSGAVYVALALFFAGVLFTAGSMLLALSELRQSLTPVTLESTSGEYGIV
jgi:Protein of unknown function (DUF2721)